MSVVMVSHRFCFYLTIVLFLSALLAGSADAEQSSAPVYNEATKSYFQLVEGGDYSWQDAKDAAERLVYKNVRGRLAVVPDRQVSEFLRQTFEPRIEAWIGLRYFCGPRKSLWESGQLLDRRGYQNWASQWYGDANITCTAQPGMFQYMPVYYTRYSRGFRWKATGPKKRFFGFFVEFATGSP